MNDGDSVTKHLNAFNTIMSRLLSMDIKTTKEEKCISLLCYFPDSWDNLLVAIGSNNTTVNIDDAIASLLLEDMRRKTMEGLTP